MDIADGQTTRTVFTVPSAVSRQNGFRLISNQRRASSAIAHR